MPTEDSAGHVALSSYAVVVADPLANVSQSALVDALLRNTPDPVFILDRSGRLLRMGEAGARALGLTGSEIVGKTLGEAGLVPDVAVEMAGQVKRVLETRENVSGTGLLSFGTTSRLYEYELSPLLDSHDVSGEVTALLCMTRDVTDRQLLLSERSLRQGVQAARMETQEALRDEQERYRLIVETASEGICLLGSDATLEYVNPRTLQMLGYSAEEMLGRSLYNFVFPDDLPRFQQSFLRRKQGLAEQYEVRLRRRDGTELWILAHSTPWLDSEGRFLGSLKLFTDLTDRKRQEAEIATLNQDLQRRLQVIEAIFNTVPAALCITEDTECRVMHGNPAAYEMLRLPEGVNLSKTGPEGEIPPFRVYHNGQEARAEDLPMQFAARTGQDIRGIECDIVFEDGSICNWYGGASPLFDEEGKTRGSVGAFVDITDRKQAEAKLKELARATEIGVDLSEHKQALERLQDTETRLTLGMQVAGLALAEIDYETGMNHLTAPAARMFGLGDEAMAVPREVVHATFHPDDQDELRRRIADCLDPQGAGWFAMDHRVLWYSKNNNENNEVRWLRVRKQVFFEGVGEARRPVRAMLAAFDVTKKNRALEALRTTEEFVRRVLDSLPELVVVLDDQGVVRSVNERWEQFAARNDGVPGAVSRGVNYLDVCRRSVAAGEEQVREVLEGLEAILAGQRTDLAVEYPCHTGNQEQWFLMSARRTPHPASRIVISHVDITERKRAERQIKDLNIRLQRAVNESHHRIKNNLQVLAAIVEIQTPDSGQTVPLSDYMRIGEHIRTLSTLHDLLTTESKRNVEHNSISLKATLEKIAPMFQIGGSRRLIVQAEEVIVSLKQASSFALLVNELVSNAYKHGQGDVEIRLAPLSPETATSEILFARLEVCDDGPGFPAGFDPIRAANTGLELIESLGKWDLRGTISYGNREERGAQVVVTFPISQHQN